MARNEHVRITSVAVILHNGDAASERRAEPARRLRRLPRQRQRIPLRCDELRGMQGNLLFILFCRRL